MPKSVFLDKAVYDAVNDVLEYTSKLKSQIIDESVSPATVDGVDVSTHASRHVSTGADPLKYRHILAANWYQAGVLAAGASNFAVLLGMQTVWPGAYQPVLLNYYYYTGTARNFRVYVYSNTLDGATTVTVYYGATASAISVSIGAGLTGSFEDTTNTLTNLIQLHVRISVGGTTGSIQFGFVTLDLELSEVMT